MCEHFLFHGFIESRRKVTVGKSSRPPGHRRNSRIRPIIEIHIGDDDPTRFVVQAQISPNGLRNLHANHTDAGFSMSNWQDHDNLRRDLGIRRKREASGALFACRSPATCLIAPKIVVPKHQTGFSVRKRHLFFLQELVEMVVPSVHF